MAYGGWNPDADLVMQFQDDRREWRRQNPRPVPTWFWVYLTGSLVAVGLAALAITSPGGRVCHLKAVDIGKPHYVLVCARPTPTPMPSIFYPQQK